MSVDAVDGADLALVALDDVEVAVGEDGLDGGAAEGGCAGSVGVGGVLAVCVLGSFDEVKSFFDEGDFLIKRMNAAYPTGS